MTEAQYSQPPAARCCAARGRASCERGGPLDWRRQRLRYVSGKVCKRRFSADRRCLGGPGSLLLDINNSLLLSRLMAPIYTSDRSPTDHDHLSETMMRALRGFVR